MWKRKEYKQNKIFKNVQNAIFPWVELVMDLCEKVHRVRSNISMEIKGREKLMAFKFDNFWKHGGRKKALFAILGICKVGEQYINKKIIHIKNESLYATPKKDAIVNQIYHATIGEKKKKLV